MKKVEAIVRHFKLGGPADERAADRGRYVGFIRGIEWRGGSGRRGSGSKHSYCFFTSTQLLPSSGDR